jgi:hypothetical protein
MPEPKLKVLMKPCDSGMCPSLYQDESGRVFVQGTKLSQVDRSQIALTENEEVVQISPDILMFLRSHQV